MMRESNTTTRNPVSTVVVGGLMSKPADSKVPPDWEQVLSSAARLQRLLPEAVLVGGTAAGLV